MGHEIAHYIYRLLHEIVAIDTEIILFTILLVTSAIVLDFLSGAAGKKHKASGVTPQTVTVSIDGSKALPVREYISEIQGLAGKPDALISENGFIIPLERKPLAKKLHDRYIAQLLVYMRLVEEFEGKRPPYGYLILGPNCRRFRIDNTPERQDWLQKHINDMRGILEGKAAVATPHPRKCRNCDVRQHCSFRHVSDQPVAAPRAEKSSLKVVH